MNIFSLIPAPYRLAARVAALVAIAGALMVGYLRLINFHEEIGYQQANAVCMADKLIAEQAANERDAAYQNQLRKANYESEQRQAELAADIADLSRQLERVRHDRNAMRARVAQLSTEAVRRVADAGIQLLGECEAEYGRVAEAADKCLSDRQALIDGWPK